VLEESLTGARCHTTVIGCVSPCVKDTQQTLNTLRYAESLSPNTGKRPKQSVSPAHDAQDGEEDGDNNNDDHDGIDVLRLGPQMIRSRQESLTMMDNEFKTDDAEDEDDMLI
jgi:hypothetical protein